MMIRHAPVLLLVVSLTGCGGGESAPASDARGPGSDAGTEVPVFAAHQVVATVSDMRAVLSNEVNCTIFDYPGGTGYLGSGACHTQGIAPTSHGIITSCQDQSDDLGLLARFDGALDEHGIDGVDLAAWTRLYQLDPAAPRTHVVVGQGLRPLADADLIPAVSSDSQDVPAEVTLLDIDEPLCSFVHDPGSGDRHLGASSLTMIDDTVYMVACSWDCDRFFIYQLDSLEGDCAPSLLAAFAISADDNLRLDDGAGDNNWGAYNSLALLRGSAGEMFMLAAHDGWLDTWELSGFPGPLTSFRKLAKAYWGLNQAGHNSRGMFFEGMAVDTPTESELIVWTAPHDYGLENCGNNRSCMRAIYRCAIPFI